MKTCSKCNFELPTSDFVSSGNGKYKSYCKSCHRTNQRIYRKNNPLKVKISAKKQYEKRKNYQKEYAKQWRQKNKEKLKSYYKNYLQRYPKKSKELQSKRYKRWYIKNKKKVLTKDYARKREKYKNNPKFRISCLLRSKIQSAINKGIYSKYFQELIGCSLEELKNHLKSKFDNKMTWDNYGSYWHIDHIIPMKNFNLFNEKELKKCMNYKNLQPLEASANLKKGYRIINNLVEEMEKSITIEV